VRAIHVALVACIAAGCSGSPTTPPADTALPDAPVIPPTLRVYPFDFTAPPGAWADSIVQIDGTLGGTWELSIDGLPPGVTATFVPAELTPERPGAVLQLDYPATSDLVTSFATVHVRRGDVALTEQLTLSIRDDGGVPDFALYTRRPMRVLPDGNKVLDIAADGTLTTEIRVVSIGGFTGTVYLPVSGPLRPDPVTPTSVVVAPGVVGSAQLVGTEGNFVAASSGRQLRQPTIGLLPTGELDAPHVVLEPRVSRVLVPPGTSASAGMWLHPYSIPDALNAQVTRVDAPLTATANVDAQELTITAPANAPAGLYRVDLLATAGAYSATSYTRAIVPATALPDAELVRAPLDKGSSLEFVVDVSGTELRYVNGTHALHALSSDAFATSTVIGPTTFYAVTGVLGGRVTMDLSNGALSIVEQRSDVGSLPWFPITGVTERPALAYNASNDLVVAFRDTSGRVTARRRQTNGIIADASNGLPTTASSPPVMVGGPGQQVMVLLNEGMLKAFRWTGVAWVQDATIDALQLGPTIALAMESNGTAVIGYTDDAGVLHVGRIGQTFTDLALPVTPGAVALDVALTVTSSGKIAVLWSEAAHGAPQPTLGPSGARLRYATYTGTWSTPVSCALDAGAVPRNPALVDVADGPYLAWTEDDDIILVRAPL